MTQPPLAPVTPRTGMSPSAREVHSSTQTAKAQQNHPAETFLQRHKHERLLLSCVLWAPRKEEPNRSYRQLLVGRMKALQSPAAAPSRRPRNGVSRAGGSSSCRAGWGARPARGLGERLWARPSARPGRHPHGLSSALPLLLPKSLLLFFDCFRQPVTVTEGARPAAQFRFLIKPGTGNP